MKHFFFLCLLVVASSLFSKEVKLTFETVTFDESIESLYYFSEDEYQLINIPQGKKSTKFTYSGPEELVFYKERAGEKKAVAQLTLTGDGKDLLLVFIPQGQRFRVIPILNEGEENKNTLHFYNFSKADVAASLLGNSAQVETNRKHVFSLKGMEKNKSRVRLNIAQRDSEEAAQWKLVHSANYPFFNDMRWIALWLDGATEPKMLMDFPQN